MHQHVQRGDDWQYALTSIPVYRPGTNLPPRGVFFSTLAALFMGPIYGGILFVISKKFYLVVVFPVVVGLLGAGFMLHLLKQYQVQHRRLAVALVLLTGMMCYATFHYAGYIDFQSRIGELIEQDRPRIGYQEKADIVQEFLEYETGQRGFWGYLLLSNREGYRFGAGSSGGGLHISGVILWVYWVIELGLFTLPGVFLTRSSAGDPLCERCRTLLSVLHHAGSYALADRNTVLQHLNRREFQELVKLQQSSSLASETIELYLWSCSSDSQCPSVLEIAQAKPHGATIRSKRMFQGLLTSGEAAELRKIES